MYRENKGDDNESRKGGESETINVRTGADERG
jgi:hypothetical protein